MKTCPLPTLPRYRELVSQLRPIHARLSCENFVARRHPVYRCSEVQVQNACFLIKCTVNIISSGSFTPRQFLSPEFSCEEKEKGGWGGKRRKHLHIGLEKRQLKSDTTFC